MFNTTTGLIENYNTGNGLSSLQIDSLINSYNVDLGNIEDLGSGHIITNDERTQISTNTSAITTNSSAIATNQNAISANSSAITTNQNAISTNSSAILAINSKIAPITYQPSPNELYINSNVLLQDPANSATKYDLTANSIFINSIESNGVNLNTAITSLETKTTNQTFASNRTFFTGDFEVERLTINGININKGSGSIITTAERDSLDSISDFTKNVISDTLFIDNHLYIGSVGTQKDITCNDIDCSVITPYTLAATANLSVGGITFPSTMPGQIATNAASIATNATNIATNTSNIGTNSANISINLQSINAINMSINALAGEVDYNSRRQLANTSIPVYENTNQTSNTDLTTSGNSNSNFELKTQLFDIEINNQSTQLTKNYYVPTNIGNKRIVNLQFIYKEAAVGSALFRIYPPEFLKYYDSNAPSAQQSRILIENIPPSFDIEGILSIEYIN